MAKNYFTSNFFSGGFFGSSLDVGGYERKKKKQKTYQYPQDRAEIRRILLQQLHPSASTDGSVKLAELSSETKVSPIYLPDYKTAKLLEQFLDDEESITLLLLQ